MADLSATISNSLATLSTRERRMVGVAAAALIAFIVFFVVFSFNSKANRLRARTAADIQQLTEVQDLAAGYREQKAAQDAIERQLQASNIRLISFLEEKAKDKGIELPSINPKPDQPLDNSKIIESAVELTLTDVRIDHLVEFLSSVEAGPAIVKVKYMRLEPKVANETVTAWLTIATYHVKG